MASTELGVGVLLLSVSMLVAALWGSSKGDDADRAEVASEQPAAAPPSAPPSRAR